MSKDKSAEDVLRLENISCVKDGRTILNNVSLSLKRGEFFSIFGGSGSGKSTLLRIIAGIERPTSGRIYLSGIDITDTQPYQRPLNLIFQSYGLFPHMNVSENIMFGLRQEHLSEAEVNARTDQALELVKLSRHRSRSVNELSGGEKQRVAIARAIAKRPALLLLDEPFAALDKSLQESTQLELVNLQESLGMTFLMVTHDQVEAMTVSSRIAVLYNGAVSQIGKPHEIYESPNSLIVANFVGDINVISGKVVSQNRGVTEVFSEDVGCVITTNYNQTLDQDSEVFIVIRPEKISITTKATQNSIPGKVSEIAYLGDMSIYHVLLSSGYIIKTSVINKDRNTNNSITWDQEVFVNWAKENTLLLRDEGTCPEEASITA